MAKRGPKRKYQSAFDFETAVNKYMKKCRDENVFPDIAGMRLFLGVSQQTIDRYCTGDDEEAVRFRNIMDSTKDERQSWLERFMVSNPKAANGCMNALKQPHNGGYFDRPVDTSEKTLTIIVNNVGGEQAFK